MYQYILWPVSYIAYRSLRPLISHSASRVWARHELTAIPVVLWVLVRWPRHVHVVSEDREGGRGENRVGGVRQPLPFGGGRSAAAAAAAGRGPHREPGRSWRLWRREVEGDLDLAVVELLLVLVVLFADRIGQTENAERDRMDNASAAEKLGFDIYRTH